MTSIRSYLPDVFLVGAPKAGTTSLADWLTQHPDVYFSIPKEPFYWAADYPAMRARYGFETRSAYEALYASPASRGAAHRAEGSTTYLYSRRAVPDILAEIEQPKFIVALRRPVDLLVSYHRTQLVALNEDEQDFSTAWRRSVEGRGPKTTPLDPKLVDYPMVGRLGAAVDRLLSLVPRDSVHFVLFEELAENPSGTWEGLRRFLGLSDQAPLTFDMRNASTKTYRSAAIRRLTHRPPRVLAKPVRKLRQWSRTTPSPAAARLKSRMWKAEGRPDLALAARAEVTHYLADDTQRLGELVGCDLSHWVSVPGR